MGTYCLRGGDLAMQRRLEADAGSDGFSSRSMLCE